MTEFLYMKDTEACYIKNFEATVTKTGDDWVILDRTAFYPEGGGQPSDTGKLIWEGGSARVVSVSKKGGVRHYLEGPVPTKGTEVHGIIDWERRYGHMRAHTSQHIISAVVWDRWQAKTVGNQLYENRARIDFHPLKLTEVDVRWVEEECNRRISRNIDVRIYEMNREEAEKRAGAERCNMDLLPKSIKKLRIVQVGDEICPCAGTHVKNTSEIGILRIVKKESKGKMRTRVTYELV